MPKTKNKLKLNSILSKLSPTHKWMLFAIPLIAYYLASPWMLLNWGPPSRLFAYTFMILAALFWGMRVGVIVAVAGLIPGVIIHKVLGLSYEGGMLGPIFSVLMIAVVGHMRDLHAKLDTEIILKERNYQEIYNATNEAIFIHDSGSGAILDVNQTMLDMYGYSYEEALKLKVNDLSSMEAPYTIEEAKAFMEMAVNKGPQVFDWHARRKNGELFWVEVALKSTEIGGIGRVLAVVRDISYRKQIEKELRQAQKMESIGTLAGGIAHDFNNILFPISGHTEMLLLDTPADSPLHHGLSQILVGAKRAGELVTQILTFSHQGEHELKPVKVELVVKEVLKLIRSSLPTTIEIRQNVDKDCGLVMADPTQIHQIVMNLVTNAYHAMEETGGNLNVTLKEVELGVGELIDLTMDPGSYVCLTVADTGMGMDQSVIDRIFDPYFTTKEEGKGTGLGLSVVHGIVKSHGGNISVYSEPGKGTEFKVYLPVIKEQKETAKVETDTSIQKGDELILLVDDQDIIVQIEKQMLERLGYHVTARTSSIEALEVFRANPHNFDLVITDLTMPNMTGDKLAQKLMAIRPDIPVILCTGFSEKMSKEKAEGLGIEGFLMKPVVMKDLSGMIRKLLDKK